MAEPQPTPRPEIPMPPRRQLGQFWSLAMLFTACVLLVNGLFGERGLIETNRARRTRAQAQRDLDELKRENAALRAVARRLRTDPATIEAVARGELGMIRKGEILVTIRDTK